jgi:SpoVK/Ycf46/Vps4 family AAA+-type ATPase
LFGKRTEVKDAHDRYVNLVIRYLLERIEQFKGLAILATNSKNDIDQEFLSRFQYGIDFPFSKCKSFKLKWRRRLING